MRRTRHRHRTAKLALVAGFAALLVGVLSARGQPAPGYELSILSATPAAYWLGVGVALAAAVLVGLYASPGTGTRAASLVLAGVAILTVVGLPVIRGYYFFGGGDSLTHYGWIKDITTGTIQPDGLLYPAIHIITIFMSDLMGVPVPLSLEYMTLAFTLIFLLFVPLCVRLVATHPLSVPVATFAAVLLLPNNNVSAHMMAHPITQSMLFLPFALYLMFRYALWPGPNVYGFGKMTPIGVLLGLGALAAVMLHPQGALNIIFIFATVAILQWLVRRYAPMSRIARHRPMYAPTVLFLVAFLLWAPRFERVQGSVQSVLTGLIRGADVGNEVATRSLSLQVLGGSITELFLKLFLGTVLFILLAAIPVWAVMRDKFGPEDPDRRAVAVYLAAATVPLVAGFAVFFAASVSTQSFRYIGFAMVPVTILGVMGLTDALADSWSVSGRGIAIVGVVVLAVAMPMAVVTVHSSPFIYQPTSGVSHMHMDGYQTAFEHRDEGVAWTGVRSGPRRYLHATYGTEQAIQMDVPGDREFVREDVWGNNLTTHYEDQRYMAVTDRDVMREVRLYRGLRYGGEGFRQLDRDPAINRVVANEEFQLYLVGSGNQSTTAGG